LFAQIINVGERKVHITKDFKTERGLEANLIGRSADLVLVHGVNPVYCSLRLRTTLELIVIHKGGAVIFVDKPMWRVLTK